MSVGPSRLYDHVCTVCLGKLTAYCAVRRKIIAMNFERQAAHHEEANANEQEMLRRHNAAKLVTKGVGAMGGVVVAASGVIKYGVLTAAVNAVPFVSVSCVAPPVAIVAGLGAIGIAVMS